MRKRVLWASGSCVIRSTQSPAAAEAKSLAHRNIYRDRFGFELASGQMAASAMGFTPLDRDQATKDAGLHKIPLWYYCLQEATETGHGKRYLCGSANDI